MRICRLAFLTIGFMMTSGTFAQELYRNGRGAFDHQLSEALGFSAESVYMGKIEVRSISEHTAWVEFVANPKNQVLDGLILNTMEGASFLRSYAVYKDAPNNRRQTTTMRNYGRPQFLQVGQARILPFTDNPMGSNGRPISAEVDHIGMTVFRAVNPPQPTLEIYGYKKNR